MGIHLKLLEGLKKEISIFRKKRIEIKKEFPFETILSNDIIQQNRLVLNSVDDWIDSFSFNNSVYKYGIPDFIKTEVNKKINNELTYSDLLNFISKKYFVEIKYLEIGVSVGKNFLQILEGSNFNSILCGLDIEKINPVLERRLKKIKDETWETSNNSLKKNKSSKTTYLYGEKEVVYACGDIWDNRTWHKISNQKFNIIFSDALHSPDAIKFEFEQILKYEMLDERFVFIWDDLEGEMETAFITILKKYQKKINIKDAYLIKINGWVGEYEKKHTVGIISNFKFNDENCIS